MKSIRLKSVEIKQRSSGLSGKSSKAQGSLMAQKRTGPVEAARSAVQKSGHDEAANNEKENPDPVQDASQEAEQETLASADRTADWALRQTSKLKHHVYEPKHLAAGKRTKTASNKQAGKNEEPIPVRTMTSRKSRSTARPSGRTIKASRFAVKTAQNSRKAAKRSKVAVKTARSTSRRMLKIMKASIKTSVRTVKITVKAVIVAAKGTVAAIKSIGALISAGGWVAVLVILVMVIIGWLFTSPVALFWSDTDDPRSLPIVMAELRQETADQIEQIKRDHEDVNDVQIIYEGSEDGAMVRNDADILAVYAVRVSMDANQPDDLISLDDRKEDVLKETYRQMVQIRYSVKDIELDEDHIDDPASNSSTDMDEDDSSSVQIPSAERLVIYVNCQSYDEVIHAFSLSPDQISMLKELMQPEFQVYFMSLTGNIQPDPISAEQIRRIGESLPADLTSAPRMALHLTVKVRYGGM